MSKKIAAVVTDLFEDVELTSPQKALTDAGHEVVIVGEEKGKEITGKKGEKFKVDLGIDEVNAADYDAVLIPGGFSPDLLRGDEQGRFGEFVKHFVQNEKPSFAICHGPQLLIDTDLLEGKTVTSFLSVRKDLQNAGAKVVDESVVVDKGIVTSRTPDDLEDFNRESLALLQ
ncbi:type 1 glutamine amidotransferase [Mammaliicoccus fleurettii]|uniref:Type 1 glutamine amidotransferase n=1 Tax=Mammaliicoccus fleurettii TaxID=150056 RepID=A0ABS5MNP6_9STAP|nr:MULTISPECIES: type 1 glutamine amidotransferase domain-containing protein [Mammaliicoccus]MBL0846669.1 type 1 glutamine amidotransferase [Mammaliicoccus fleurettii]MBS3672621.1 type 1 glutamine amidotransferase [Mammaliicoccus fleurettii]MBS3697543.1 type 1 glutamine amidotransferase [Mammaliicoccus fleurettii]MBW0765761.1 type 1 glutamine amidotransferase [Mammaliicoccus fleurettii]MEB6201519.1 type 1 glutamine amidotransferase [Mammaliicoccus fleurettii]